MMCDLTISDLLARAGAVRKAAEGLPDDLFHDVCRGAWKLELAALAAPCADSSDLAVKLKFWDELIADPLLILDEHVLLWERLKADWKAVAT